MSAGKKLWWCEEDASEKYRKLRFLGTYKRCHLGCISQPVCVEMSIAYPMSCIVNNKTFKIFHYLESITKLNVLYPLFNFDHIMEFCTRCRSKNCDNKYTNYICTNLSSDAGSYSNDPLDIRDDNVRKLFGEFMEPVVECCQATFIVCHNRIMLPKDVAKLITRIVYKNYFI